MRDKILLLGNTGIIGSSVLVNLKSHGFQQVVASNSSIFNLLTCLHQLPGYIDEIKPKIIINCAAFTKIDAAEHNQELCFWLNSIVPQYLAKYTTSRAIKLIHFSTDYVFDGTKDSCYTENDLYNPLNFYGYSKAYTDKLLFENYSQVLIFRISGIVSSIGSNFLTAISRKLLSNNSNSDPISVVNDVIVAPTSSDLVANVIVSVLMDEVYTQMNGVYNLSAQGKVSWFEYACQIAENLGLSPNLIKPVTLNTYCTSSIVAKRPQMCLLDTSKLQKKLDFALPHWSCSLSSLLSGITLNNNNSQNYV